MTTFQTINPHTNEVLETYQSITVDELKTKLDKAEVAYQSWKKTSFKERAALMMKVADLLKTNTEEYAKMITLEMGKPIVEARGEVKKCAWVCEYYAENAEGFLIDEIIETDAQKSFVSHSPIGAVFAVMPWNFPFWQVLRFAAPTLMAGNVGILKHAPNVFGSAIKIEELFTKAGFPEGVFQNLIIHHDETEKIVSHSAIKAITLTGSERAGSAVASLAGKYIKKSLLELGGSNAFIVWKDADIDQSVKTALTARMLNAGQSCIAAKRFLLHTDIYEEFVSKFVAGVSAMKAGDPLNEDTKIGPLARKDLAEELQKQVQSSIAKGAELLLGGKQTNCFHEPTILGNVTPGMAAFDEETFGPLAAMIKVSSEEESIQFSEMSKFGLGVTICTKDIDKALAFAPQISDGALFINEMVKSDPRLPFGGSKLSGYGRELSKDGILEFVNRKTVYVK
jgi:succinate-semialdehyde dehydrogenase/glutarate-semialdehyde dehydrogenase